MTADGQAEPAPGHGAGEAPMATPAAPSQGSTGAEEPKQKRPKWLPLESNPDVLNGFMQRVGVVGEWEFVDVLGLDAELLRLVPKPVMAVCLLFPDRAIRKPRLEALEADKATRRAPAGTFYLIQHKEFGNACGTIAAVHAIGNLARSGAVRLAEGSPIESFLLTASDLSPEDAGRALAAAEQLHEASDHAAKSEKAQTKTPGRDDRVEGHFVVFVEVAGHVVELDGCMGSPIDHGAVSEGGLMEDAGRIIREEFMARAPGNPNFSVMALTPGSGAASSGDCHAPVDKATQEAQVLSLVSMGFPEIKVREALEAAGWDPDAAVGLLC